MSENIQFDELVLTQRIESPMITPGRSIVGITRKGLLLNPENKDKLEELNHRSISLDHTTQDLKMSVCEVVDDILNDYGYGFNRKKLRDLLRTIYRPNRRFNFGKTAELYWFDYSAPMIIISDEVEALIAPRVSGFL